MEADSSLGPYEILKRLGQGGMGEVYLARDTRLGRTAALKIVSDRKSDDETAGADLLREARIASKLNHPHICTIYDVGEDNDHPLSVRRCNEGLVASLESLENPRAGRLECV